MKISKIIILDFIEYFNVMQLRFKHFGFRDCEIPGFFYKNGYIIC